MKIKKLLIIPILLFIFSLPVLANNNWVRDDANVLSEATENYIKNLNENTFVNYKNKPQLAIIMLNELPIGYSIDDYKLEVFNQNGIGTKQENCGMLFIFSITDKKYGFEIGDGFKVGSLLRKDLENDFITSDMKKLLRDGNYDSVVFRLTQQIAQIMKDEETGIYNEKELILQAKITDGNKESQYQLTQGNYFINQKENINIQNKILKTFFIIAFLSLFLAIIKTVYRKIKIKSNIKNILPTKYNYIKLFNGDINLIEKELNKNIIYIVGIEKEINQYLYSKYLIYMTDNLKKEDLKYNFELYNHELCNLNNFDNFIILNLQTINDIIHKVNTNEEFLLKIEEQNKNNIDKYINEHLVSVKYEYISSNSLKQNMYKHIIRKNNIYPINHIKDIFDKELKELQFENEYQQFLKEHENDIDKNYFKSNKFKESLRNSTEYQNYHYRNNNNIWMYASLMSHIQNNRHYEEQRIAEQKARDETLRQNSSNNSFGSGFGGGSSSGGGFSGGW